MAGVLGDGRRRHAGCRRRQQTEDGGRRRARREMPRSRQAAHRIESIGGVAVNSSCSNALLEAVLAGDLPPDDESALARHLEECEACSSALERLAGGPAWCREAASLLAEDELDADSPS